MSKLTEKQEKFVQGLMKGLSQRQAYKNSYNASKMKDSVIDVKANELLKVGKVSERYNELRGKVIKKIEDEGVITRERIIREIAAIALDDIGNYLEYKNNPKSKFGIDIIVKNSDEVDTKNISEVSIGKDGFKFKTYCRDAALYKLAEMFDIKNKLEEKGDNEGLS